MSTLKTNKAQFGQSGTATQNFTITAEAANGTMKLARGNAGDTTQDILTVDAAGKVTFPQGSGNLIFTNAVTPLPTLNGAVLTAAHGLPSAPVEAVVELTCLVAEHGYSVGDKFIANLFSNGANFFQIPIWWNSTNVGISSVATIAWITYHKAGGAASFNTLTPANWSYRFRMRTA